MLMFGMMLTTESSFWLNDYLFELLVATEPNDIK